MVDLLKLMDFEAGELSLTEIIEMLSDMLKTGNIDNEGEKFRKLAKKYINMNVLDEEGNINYILLNQINED